MVDRVISFVPYFFAAGLQCGHSHFGFLWPSLVNGKNHHKKLLRLFRKHARTSKRKGESNYTASQSLIHPYTNNPKLGQVQESNVPVKTYCYASNFTTCTGLWAQAEPPNSKSAISGLGHQNLHPVYPVCRTLKCTFVPVDSMDLAFQDLKTPIFFSRLLPHCLHDIKELRCWTAVLKCWRLSNETNQIYSKL